MLYSQLYFKRFKTNMLPHIGLFFLVFILFFFVVQKKLQNSTWTAVKKLPAYRITDISDKQAGIYWETDMPEEGWILINSTPLYDVRDTKDLLHKVKHHYVPIPNLRADTPYQILLMSKKGPYNDGKHVSFRTQRRLIGTGNIKTAYGKVLLPNGKPARNVLVLLEVQKKSYVAFTKETGEWLMSFSESSPQERISLTYKDEGGKTSFLSSVVSNISPVTQTVVLGTNYSLLAKGEVLSASASDDAVQKLPLTVQYPRENALIPAGKPLIKGMGVRGEDVFVFINSRPQYSFRTTVDNRGEWRILPTNSIGSGTYTASVTSTDGKGSNITIKRKFMIAKSGEQVLGDATGSATTPTPTIFPTVAITPSIVSPAVYVPPIMHSTIYPTQIPTSTPPTTGSSIHNIIYASIAFIVMGLGIMLVF